VADDDTASESRAPRRTREAQTEAESGPPSYPTERLIAEAPAFLDCEPHVAAGALYDSPRDMTVKDAKAAVKAWLKREIPPSGEADAGEEG
jgi:hypothetical protein